MEKTTVNGFVVPANYKASIANFHTPSEAKRKLAKRKGKAANNGKKRQNQSNR